MPDSPDYLKYLPGSVRFSLQDMGELSVRMGSINVYDRRGEVVWYDDFSHGQIGWTNTLHSGSDSVKLAINSVFLSPYSMRYVQVTSGTPRITSSRNIGVNLTGRIGIDVILSFTSRADKFDLRLTVNQNGVQHDGNIRFDHTNGLLYIFDQTGNFISTGIATDPLLIVGSLIFIKMVYDLHTGKYTRVLVNDTEYDLSAFSFYRDSGGYTSIATAEVDVWGNTSTATDMNFMQVIVTSNEP